jgi:hypothetical protein
MVVLKGQKNKMTENLHHFILVLYFIYAYVLFLPLHFLELKSLSHLDGLLHVEQYEQNNHEQIFALLLLQV